MEVNDNTLAVTLTVEQWTTLIRECIREELQDLHPEKEDAGMYLTRSEVCERLRISLPTLSRYSDLGLLPAKKVGNRVLYLQEDVQNALLPTRKHK